MGIAHRYSFTVRDIAGPFVVDACYFCSNGEARVDNGDNNVLETYAGYGEKRPSRPR